MVHVSQFLHQFLVCLQGGLLSGYLLITLVSLLRDVHVHLQVELAHDYFRRNFEFFLQADEEDAVQGLYCGFIDL